MRTSETAWTLPCFHPGDRVRLGASLATLVEEHYPDPMMSGPGPRYWRLRRDGCEHLSETDERNLRPVEETGE